MQGSARTTDRPAVIAGVDRSAAAAAVLRYAAAEADRRGLPLRLLHVVTLFGGEELPVTPSPGEERILGAMRRQARELSRAWPRARRTPTLFALRYGSPIGELIAAAGPGSRLVVAAADGASARTRGVVATALAARVECPVTVVPRQHPGHEPDGAVVVGYKDRWESTAALGAGVDEAVTRGLRLVVLHARVPRDPVGAEAAELGHLAELVAALRSRAPAARVEVRTADRDFARVVEELLTPDDLLVLGRSTAWTTHPVLGPAARALLSGPPCPVLVVPPVAGLGPDVPAQRGRAPVSASVPSVRGATR
jgi:nucleotide-binding universal stress UspA family protein